MAESVRGPTEVQAAKNGEGRVRYNAIAEDNETGWGRQDSATGASWKDFYGLYVRTSRKTNDSRVKLPTVKYRRSRLCMRQKILREGRQIWLDRLLGKRVIMEERRRQRQCDDIAVSDRFEILASVRAACIPGRPRQARPALQETRLIRTGPLSAPAAVMGGFQVGIAVLEISAMYAKIGMECRGDEETSHLWVSRTSPNRTV
ncbi:hypothetical protein HPP92_000359 [Vanilla planifolia]|uniref:Uncharacterized protein n=1 Tax=Vanilla planifolia TaxID=51239 RepID=A0A835VIN2_VANPL|nr:hypothetical protein HPP92_000359 [Vanilla planifolia]